MSTSLDTYLDLLVSEVTTLRAQHNDNRQWWERHQPSECPVCIKEYDRLTRHLGTTVPKPRCTCSHCGNNHIQKNSKT